MQNILAIVDDCMRGHIAVQAKKGTIPFRYFNHSPEIIGLRMITFVRFPPHNRTSRSASHFAKSRLAAIAAFLIKADGPLTTHLRTFADWL